MVTWKMKYFPNSRFSYVFSLIILFSFVLCRPLSLENDCEFGSKNFLRNTILVQIFQLQSAGCYPGFIQNPVPKNRVTPWGFFGINTSNGLVRDIKILDTKAYVAGLFDYIGPNTGSLVMLNQQDQTLLPESSCPYFEIDGLVNEMISDGNGNVIISGNFNHIQGIKRRAIAKIKSDCTLDESFNLNLADTSAEIRSLFLFNGKLYIAGLFSGRFSTTSSVIRNYVAVVSPDTGLLDLSFDANLTASEVNVIKSDGTYLYLGGSISQVGATSVVNLARVNLFTGAFDTFLGEPDGTVTAMIIEGSNIYVGGNFSTIDGNTSNYLAKITNTGTFIWGNASIDSTVRSLILTNQKLYVGGSFSAPRSGMITLDPTTGGDLNKDFKISVGNVNCIRKLNDKLFIFGSFTSILDTQIQYIASIDPSNDSIQPWNAQIGGPNESERGDIFRFSNGNYLVGGSFPTLQGKLRNFLAEIDLISGKPTDWNPSFVYPGGGVEAIEAIHIYQNRLYIGGSFSSVNSIARTRFASFDLTSSPTPTLTNLNISISGYTQNVFSISDIDGKIIVTGGFSNVSGTNINHVFLLDPRTDTTSFNFNPNTNFGVKNYLKLTNGKTIIAGDFTQINGSTAINRFASVNASTGSLLQSPSGTSIGLINRLLESSDKLFVGFYDVNAPSSTGCCLGIYDTINFTPISHNLSISPASGSEINDLYSQGGELFLMGSFNNVQSAARNNFASVTLDTLQLTEYNPNFSAKILRMAESPSHYYFVGRFQTVTGRKRNYLARVRKSDKSLLE